MLGDACNLVLRRQCVDSGGVSHFSVVVVKKPSPRQQIGGRIVWSTDSSGISICHDGKAPPQSAGMTTAAGRWVLTS